MPKGTVLSIKGLVASLTTLAEPPVELDEIVRWIKAHDFDGEIKFRPTKRFEKLGGVFESRLVSGRAVAKIWYNDNLPVSWINFICCKELLHLFDSKDETISSKEDISSLINQIGAFLSEDTIDQALAHIGQDYSNVILALVVLVPAHLLQRYEDPYRAGKLSIEEISEIFQIPPEFTGVVFSRFFKPLYYKFLT